MTARQIGVLLALLAMLALVGGLFGSSPAAAGRNGNVQLAVGGRGYTAHPVGPVIDTSRLAPGVGIDARFGVRSNFTVATDLSLRLTDVHDDDNGCGPAEARVDGTCGAEQGDLGHVLVVTVAEATTREGSYRPVWTGTAQRLRTATAVGLTVPADADRWLRLSLSVPSAVGNIVESDTFRFGMRVGLQGNGVSGGSGIAGEQTGKHTGRPGATLPVAGLARTGLATVLFLTGGTLLIAAGVVLVSAGRRDRRATSAWSSTGRREPRRASPPRARWGRARVR